MRGLVVAGGEGPPDAVLRMAWEASDFACAADSGLDALLAADLVPDIVAGDMDSLSDVAALEAFPSGSILRYPADKDLTDTEIAVSELERRGCDAITVSGCGGGRIDHLIAVLALFERESVIDELLTARELVVKVRSRASFVVAPGDIVSVFPLGERAEGLASTGLKWPLDGRDWRRGQFGVSNEATDTVVTVGVRRGELLVSLPLPRAAWRRQARRAFPPDPAPARGRPR